MQVTNDMIHPELRFRGRILRKLLPLVMKQQHDENYTIPRRKQKKSAVRLLKGKCWSRSLHYEQQWIKRPDGSDLRICIYMPEDPGEKVPGLLWMHGGGYSLGTPEQDKLYIKRFIKASRCVVVAPDYRLSVEAPYPAALDDCYIALCWLHDNTGKYNINRAQIIVGGNSAGGGLTAALCMYARDKNTIKIAFQMPLYPMLDDRNNSESAKDNDAPVWNEKTNNIGWKMYLGDLYGTEDIPYYAAPARAVDYRNLPPAITFVGSIESFRDETINYMNKLQENNIPVHYEVFEGCFHAFDLFGMGTHIAKQAVTFLMDSYKYALEHYVTK